MPSYVGLIRAVNLGGGTQLSMKELAVEMDRRGFRAVRTLLQSGNVVFQHTEPTGPTLEDRLETMLRERFGLSTDVFLRAPAEWAALIAANPFPRMARDDPGHLQAVVLKSSPSTSQWQALRAAVVGREEVAGMGRTAYITFPDGIGRSKLTPGVIERALGSRGTARNWNTVLRLQAAVGPSDTARTGPRMR